MAQCIWIIINACITHGKRFIRTYIDAATKHKKQAKQGSLGTELAPQVKHIQAPSSERERWLHSTLCTINKYAGA